MTDKTSTCSCEVCCCSSETEKTKCKMCHDEPWVIDGVIVECPTCGEIYS